MAEGTVEGWLPGYSDFDEAIGGQWRITSLGDSRYKFEPAFGAWGGSPRTFRIRISATEEK